MVRLAGTILLGVLVALSACGKPVTPTPTPTGSMATARFDHTATLLPNGKVLVAGGFGLDVDGTSRNIASAELYDPATGSFSSTGSMTTARLHHTATLLPNGKILVAGGIGTNGDPLTSAELYDPATGSFSSTGSMTTARHVHTATLLPNGKVLVAGGISNIIGPLVSLASAELYDPATGSFSFTGSMTTSRGVHTATLLLNGKILMVGGWGSSGAGTSLPLDSAELYDPATKSFSSTGSMAADRFGHTATLLSNGKVLVAGGGDFNGLLASAELYDPATRSFSSTGSMAADRFGHRATLLNNGKVLVAGGRSNILGPLVSAELYDPATGSFSSTGSMTTSRRVHTATLLSNGKVLVAGGMSNIPSPLASAELYDPAIGSFSLIGSP